MRLKHSTSGANGVASIALFDGCGTHSANTTDTAKLRDRGTLIRAGKSEDITAL